MINRLGPTCVILFVCCFFAGCATPYQKMGFRGGHKTVELQDNIFNVEFRGNAYTSKSRSNDFALLRCAEVSLEKGCKYFAILDEDSYISTSTYTTPIQSTTTGSFYGNSFQANTKTSGGDTYYLHKPSVRLLVQCFKEKPEKDVFVYDATQICKNIRNSYNIKNE